jgi:hypothetical protein
MAPQRPPVNKNAGALAAGEHGIGPGASAPDRKVHHPLSRCTAALGAFSYPHGELPHRR